jgi:hypothetical protein
MILAFKKITKHLKVTVIAKIVISKLAVRMH